MPRYVYRGVDASGAPVEGEMEGASPHAVAGALRELGYQVNEVAAGEEAPLLPRKSDRLSWRDLELFNEQLGVIVRSGLPLAPSLQSLAEEIDRPALARVVLRLRDDIDRGRSLTEAIARHGEHFPPEYRGMVAAGERAGNLSGVLYHLTDYATRMTELTYHVRSALAYPLLIAIVYLGVVGVILFAVLPGYHDLFDDYGARLPGSTRLWLSVSDALRAGAPVWMPLVPVAVVALWLLSRWAQRTPERRRRREAVVRRIPLVGALHRQASMARFTRALGVLLAGGVEAPYSLTLAGAASGSPRLSAAAQRAAEAVRGGQGIGEALEAAHAFGTRLCWLAGHGERRGSGLPDLLFTLAEGFESEVRRADRRLQFLVGPVAIVLLGLLIASLYGAMFSPIFTMADVMSG